MKIDEPECASHVTLGAGMPGASFGRRVIHRRSMSKAKSTASNRLAGFPGPLPKATTGLFRRRERGRFLVTGR
jgi:hypothetical protein